MALSKIDPAGLDIGQIGGRRNLIINGAMQVAQRGTSATGQTSTNGYTTCDRFHLQMDSSGTFTVSQSTTAPDGFANSFKIECTTADASPNYLLLSYRFEGQNLQQLKKGTASAESLTLSFWVRASKTGTYQVNLEDADNTRVIGATYSISSADTWEYKTVTFVGDTSGALDNDNEFSLRIEWWLASGTTFNSGAVPTNWEAKSNADRAAGLNVAIGASTSDEFYITGVQLEVGSVATPFEHRSYGEELALCQRYYEVGTSTFSNPMWSGYCTSGASFYASCVFKVTKRAAPDVTLTSTFGSGFANTSGTPATITPESFYEGRIATATQVGGFFSSTFVANAEL